MRWSAVALESRVNGSEPRVHATLDGRTTACGKVRRGGDRPWRAVAGRVRVTCPTCVRSMIRFARTTLDLVERDAIEPFVPRGSEHGGDDAGDA